MLSEDSKELVTPSPGPTREMDDLPPSLVLFSQHTQHSQSVGVYPCEFCFVQAKRTRISQCFEDQPFRFSDFYLDAIGNSKSLVVFGPCCWDFSTYSRSRHMH